MWGGHLSISFDELNPKQKRLVEHEGSPLLILAGPGTGKTLMLAFHIQHLINRRSVAPRAILAATFTTEATGKMKKTLQQYEMIESSAYPRISTLHSEARRILSKNFDKIGLPADFFVIDTDESMTLIKDAVEDLGLMERRSIKKLKREIDRMKEDNVHFCEASVEKELKKIYEHYERLLLYNRASDYSGLIMKAARLLSQNRELLAEYRQRNQHLLVDEYQDMNKAQYDLICLLAGNVDNLFVVGDDDQSIYGWRGADPSIIINFPKNFKGGKISSDVDQCWRCTEHILQGALGLVSHNRNRCHKTLHSKCGEGSLINVLHSPSEESEAKAIAEWIVKKCSNGSFRLRDIAIFYPRQGIPNKMIEELKSRGVEVECRGGGGIFRDNDIRKILAHMRILDNPNDNLALRKCLDSPTGRGIGEEGKRSLRHIAQHARQPLWDIVTRAYSYKKLEKWQKPFGRFAKQINKLREKSKELKIDELVRLLADKIGATSNKVDELKNLAKLLPEGSNLQDFLRMIRDRRLDATEGGAGGGDEKDTIKILTMHSAKGLEFKVVFLLGMENDIFPNPKYSTEKQIEEQRRSCYVAMTRARVELFMCHVTRRKGPPIRAPIRLDGGPSPFISEIPRKHVRWLKARDLMA